MGTGWNGSPDDTINNNLLMCIPSTIVHELDTWSPLTPPHKSPYSDGMEDLASYLHKWPSCSQRYCSVVTVAFSTWSTVLR